MAAHCPPNAQPTLAVGSHLNLHVQIHGPAGVRVHNVYLFLGGPGYGSGPGDSPSGTFRILTHVSGDAVAGPGDYRELDSARVVRLVPSCGSCRSSTSTSQLST